MRSGGPASPRGGKSLPRIVGAAVDLAKHGGEGFASAGGRTRARGSARWAGLDRGRPLSGVGMWHRRYGVDFALVGNEVEMTNQIGVRVAWGEP